MGKERRQSKNYNQSSDKKDQLTDLNPDDVQGVSKPTVIVENIPNDDLNYEKVMAGWVASAQREIDLEASLTNKGILLERVNEELEGLMINQPGIFNLELKDERLIIERRTSYQLMKVNIRKICKEWKLTNMFEFMSLLSESDEDHQNVVWINSLSIDDLIRMESVVNKCILAKVKKEVITIKSGALPIISTSILDKIYVDQLLVLVRNSVGKVKNVRVKFLPWWNDKLYAYLTKHINMKILFDDSNKLSGQCAELLYVISCHIKTYNSKTDDCFNLEKSKRNVENLLKQVLIVKSK